jgi:hypothetical protein
MLRYLKEEEFRGECDACHRESPILVGSEVRVRGILTELGWAYRADAWSCAVCESRAARQRRGPEN